MTRKQQLLPFSLMTFLVILVLALLTAVPARAQASAAITKDQDIMNVGDPILLTVTVTHPADSVVLFPTLEPNWGDLVVRNQSAASTVRESGNTAVTSQQIDVRIFAPGDFQTPPLPLTISDSAGNLSQTIAGPIELTVQSVLVEGDNNLRDIKPQAELPLPLTWPFVLFGLISATAAGVLLIRNRRHGADVADNRLPHEKALAALTSIDKQQVARNGRYNELYTAVSDILRTYFETIGGIPMTDRTTTEIRRDLASGNNVKADEALRLLTILAACDLVKFAKGQPSQHDAERLTESARQLILDTRPKTVTDDVGTHFNPLNKAGKEQEDTEVAP